jgi:hypothetical protein
MNTLALIFLAASAYASPLSHSLVTAGHADIHNMDKGVSYVVAEPNRFETISTLPTAMGSRKSEDIERGNVRSGFLRVEPLKTEGLYDIKNPENARTGWFNIEPRKTEGLFNVRSDAMQQSQQLDNPRFESITAYPSRSGWLKVEPSKTEGLFHIKGDAMQQSQQLDDVKAPRYGRRLSTGPKVLHVEPGKFDYVKTDAMQQSQQLDNARFKGIEAKPSTSGWIKVEPSKTEGLFNVRGDQLIPLSTERMPENRFILLVPISSENVARTDAMQQEEQLDWYKPEL